MVDILKEIRMSDFESVKEDIDLLRTDVTKISDRQMTGVTDQHRLEKELIELKAHLSYLRAGQDSMNANMTRLLFIIGGSFVAGIVGFIIKGGLV
jgi:hypothetical protein